jgi:hypothetical protein
MDEDRAHTDLSLKIERHDCDQELIGPSESELTADKVIERARDEADAVLLVARETADKEAQPALTIDRVKVDDARETADALLEAERGSADDALRHDRQEQRESVGRLQTIERARTDKDLANERAHADEAIAERDARLRDGA